MRPWSGRCLVMNRCPHDAIGQLRRHGSSNGKGESMHPGPGQTFHESPSVARIRNECFAARRTKVDARIRVILLLNACWQVVLDYKHPHRVVFMTRTRLVRPRDSHGAGGTSAARFDDIRSTGRAFGAVLECPRKALLVVQMFAVVELHDSFFNFGGLCIEISKANKAFFFGVF